MTPPELGLLESMPRGVMVVGPDLRIRFCNEAFASVWGLDVARAEGRSLELFLPSEALGDLMEAVHDALDLGIGSYLNPALGPPGGVEYEVEVVPLGVKGCIVHLDDLSGVIHEERQALARKEEIEQLRRELGRRERDATRAALYDVGTGLPNRRAFREHVRRALERASQGGGGAILLADIDGFTVINEDLGPAAGDELLREVGTRLGASLREVDIVARYGGDEFAILLAGLGRADDAVLAALRVKQGLQLPVLVRGRELFTSMGVGVAVFPDDGEDVETLLKHAETALARAKEAGQGQVQLYSKRLSRASDRLSLAGALHRAVEDEAFELHFQPQVEMSTGAVIGSEALLRWSDPERGRLSPGVFVPILEETGLIGRVGAWVMSAGCRVARRWEGELEWSRVSINVSARQFLSGDLVATVRRALEATHLPAARLELELTESLLMEDAAASARTLRDLKRMGVAIAVDDFGTGYSSLAYLKRFPVDTLKIDRTFIRDIERDAEDRTICRAIITLGHELGLSVVAEGVETRAQWDILLGFGCDIVQGFLLAKPMPASELGGWLASRSEPKAS